MPPKVTRKDLAPFKVVNSKRAFEDAKAKALLTLTRQACFDQGYLTVKDLDDEELVAGRCRDEFGRIPHKNSKTTMVPLENYEELVAEHELRYKQRLRQRLDKAIDVMTDIMEDETAEPRDRFEAAKYLFERTAGRTPETVKVTVQAAPWEEMLGDLAGIAALTRKQHNEMKAGVLDVEFTEQDDSSGPANDMADQDMAENVGQDQAVPQDGEPTDADLESVQQDRHQDDDAGVQGSACATLRSAEGQDVATHDLITDAHPELNYGRRADEERSYADQARAAAKLAIERKEARERRNNAKKQRKIARAFGADAIKTEITGAELGDDGTLSFDTT